MHWKTKAACFRVFDAIPFGSHLHFWAQKNITRMWPRDADGVAALVGIARKTVNDYQSLTDKPLQESIFFEIGAGRDLSVPIALRLLGARVVYAADVTRLAKLDLVNSAAKIVAELIEASPPPHFTSWRDVEKFGVYYSAPLDVSSGNLPELDAFVSNEVLEHVPPDALRRIFENVGRHMRLGGVSLHSIDYSDHYARDCGVSRYNFLQFTDVQWKPFNAGMHYVNRMRHSEYVKIMRETGFRIVDAETYSEEIPADINPAPQFQAFAYDDLRVMRARIRAVRG